MRRGRDSVTHNFLLKICATPTRTVVLRLSNPILPTQKAPQGRLCIGCGEGGIRTLGTLLRLNTLAVCCIRPLCHLSFVLHHITCRESNHARASASNVTSAPDRRRGAAAFTSVAPVVVTSSMRNICFLFTKSGSNTSKAPATLLSRSER